MLTKRPSSPSEAGGSSSKRPRLASSKPSNPPSLHQWLHPDLPPPLITNSPPLHSSTSTFLSFSISFFPPAHVTSESALAKEARRIVRELNVPGLVGDRCMESNEGAFSDGESRVISGKGKERAREPDHRMWAVRAICLKEGKDGTGGSDDYQLLEAYNDDGEKFGGERVLRTLKDERAVDVVAVCSRWYGGDMIGPVRFQHIALTAKTSLQALNRLTSLRDLRQTLRDLDEDIDSLRISLNPSSSQNGKASAVDSGSPGGGKYDGIDDIVKLERLVKAKEKTKGSLEGKVSWAQSEKAREAISTPEVTA